MILTIIAAIVFYGITFSIGYLATQKQKS